jgi:hypothetical protein
MSNYGAVESILQALQRQGSEAGQVRAAPFGGRLPVAPSLKPEPSLHQNPPQQESSDRPSTGGKDSFIKARYALTLLRVAQTADRETAARLIRGLARDAPLPDEVPELAGIHLRAIEAFVRLAAGLADARSSNQQHLWSLGRSADRRFICSAPATVLDEVR